MHLLSNFSFHPVLDSFSTLSSLIHLLMESTASNVFEDLTKSIDFPVTSAEVMTALKRQLWCLSYLKMQWQLMFFSASFLSSACSICFQLHLEILGKWSGELEEAAQEEMQIALCSSLLPPQVFLWLVLSCYDTGFLRYQGGKNKGVSL